jgi:hypothetical protein
MRSTLQGGSAGATGTAIAGNVSTKLLTEISTNFVRGTQPAGALVTSALFE